MVVLSVASDLRVRSLIVFTLLSAVTLVSGQTDQYQIKQLANFTYKELTNSIVKSDNDKRVYQGLELSNSLQVLLISDPDVDQAAAALDVKVGSQSDPKNLPGLAHFCEHLLFMGNEKYPDENDYFKYLKSNSGAANAFTAYEDTNYFFDIGNNALDGGLDRFAQFFISPLLKQDSVEREVNAVNSEHNKNLQSDPWRIRQVEKFLSNPNYPYSYFSTGSYETLLSTPKAQGIDTRKELLKYYKAHYSANQMKLVVIGKESIEGLKKLVIPKFSQIPNHQAELPKFKGSPFTKSQVGIQINVVPVGDKKSLEMQFLLPSQANFYDEKPTVYLSHFLGDEGAGSILARLKKLGWATSVNCGISEDNTSFSLFEINIGLTPEGLKHAHDIMKLTFGYFRLLREQGVTETRFKEIQTIAANGFKFVEKSASSGYASALAGLMHSPAPLSQVISAPSLLSRFNATVIQNTLKFFRPRRMRVTLISSSVKKMPGLKKEPWYGTQYTVEKLPESLLKELETIKLDSNLKLPQKNEFIPTNFKVLSHTDTDKRPKLITNSTGSLLWHANGHLNIPKASIRLIIKNNQLFKSPTETAKLSLFKEMVMEELVSTGYMASLAGLDYRVSATYPGIAVTVEGYNENINKLLVVILQKMKTLNVTNELFKLCQNKVIQAQEEFKVNQPYAYISYYLQTALSENSWTNDQLSLVTPKLTLKDMQQFSQQAIKQGELEMMVVGNIDIETSQKILKQVQTTLPLEPVSFVQYQSQRVVNLNQTYVYQSPLFDSQNTNSAVGVYTDLYNYNDGLQKATVQLLGQMISEPAFNELRTKEQLGYIVVGTAYGLNTRGGILVLVQSEKAPLFLESRIENLFQTFQAYLGNLTKEEVQSESKSLQQSIQTKQRNLNELADFYWQSIVTGYYDFTKDLTAIENLKKVTPQALKTLGEQLVAPANKRHRLSIHMQSQQHPLNSKSELQNNVGEPIEDLIKWRAGQKLSSYPQSTIKMKQAKPKTESSNQN